MFERFTKAAREAVTDASQIARDMGAMTIEAEHLLLAVTNTRHARRPACCATPGSTTTACAPRSPPRPTRSLAAVGVTADAPALQPVRRDAPKFGTLGQARARALAARSRSRAATSTSAPSTSRSAALQPAVGTVPRALDMRGRGPRRR